jgi:hypothetical protein
MGESRVRADEAFSILMVVLADMASTYVDMEVSGTCSGELNPVLRRMCEAIGPRATWLWFPIEFSAIMLGYEALSRLGRRLGLRIPMEKVFSLLLLGVPVNNLARLPMRYSNITGERKSI